LLLISLDPESAILKFEYLILLTAHQRYESKLGISNTALLFIVLEAAAIEKGILFSGMAVQIAVEHHPPLLVEMPDQILSVVHWGVQKTIRLFPLTIQVHAEKGAAIVAVDDTVGVQHWHDSDNEMLTELLGRWR
jgi:hypothetical protein